MASVRIVEIGDPATFELIPLCADRRFDHRTCDYWEDADRGSKAHRSSWLEVRSAPAAPRQAALEDNPFAPAQASVQENPFAPAARAGVPDTFADDDLFATPLENPFVPTTERERPLREGVPRKLALLDRGRGVFGSYAKVLLLAGEPAAYCQYGPLSAYPRAQRQRDLYPQLPQSPLPAVITCIASTAEARRQGLARRLAEDVCRDLAKRGFAAIETYPDRALDEDETSAARPEFWQGLGFVIAADDERFPVMRREL